MSRLTLAIAADAAAAAREAKILVSRRQDELRKAVSDAAAAGHSLRTIGKAIGLSHTAVANLLER